jgi:hypothetical protein
MEGAHVRRRDGACAARRRVFARRRWCVGAGSSGAPPQEGAARLEHCRRVVGADGAGQHDTANHAGQRPDRLGVGETAALVTGRQRLAHQLLLRSEMRVEARAWVTSRSTTLIIKQAPTRFAVWRRLRVRTWDPVDRHRPRSSLGRHA